MREERDVDGEVQRLGRLQLAPVDVDHVADGHEGEERNGDGQPDLQEGDGPAQPQRVGEVVDVHRDEAVVLEPTEDGEQRTHRCTHGDAPGALVAHGVDPRPTGEGNHRRQQQEQAVAPAHPAVEHVAQGDHGQFPPTRVRVEQPIHREGDGKEDCEVDCGKEHGERSARCAECTAGHPHATCTLQARRPLLSTSRGRSLSLSTAWASGRGRARRHLGVRDPGAAQDQPLAFSASISAGSTLCTSPTMPRSATEKIGASWSLLTAMMFLEPFIPTRCWVAPEIPHAM